MPSERKLFYTRLGAWDVPIYYWGEAAQDFIYPDEDAYRRVEKPRLQIQVPMLEACSPKGWEEVVGKIEECLPPEELLPKGAIGIVLRSYQYIKGGGPEIYRTVDFGILAHPNPAIFDEALVDRMTESGLSKAEWFTLDKIEDLVGLLTPSNEAELLQRFEVA